MRIFNGFLIVLVAVVLFLLPLTTAVYDFRTDVREQEFTVETEAAETAANVTLSKALYDDDTATVSFTSNATTETPTVSTWNGTSRVLTVGGLDASTTRLLTVTYDVDALANSTAMNVVVSNLDFIWLLMIIAFPAAALVAVFLGKA